MTEVIAETQTPPAGIDDPVLVEPVSSASAAQPAGQEASQTTKATAQPGYSTRQSREEATIEARQFVYDQSFGTLNTINQGGNYEGFPAGQIEYYIDTADEDGSLLLIAVDMSSAFRNISKGSTASLSIRTGDEPNGKTPLRAAAAARIILYGEFDFVEPSLAARKEFFEIHPDALEWAPGLPGFHKTQWIKFTPTGIYYIGGFGDRHYIGTIPVDKYVVAPVDKRSEPSQGILTRLSKLVWS